jgi:hypothetical protein
MLRPIRTPASIAMLTLAMFVVLPGCSGMIANSGIYSGKYGVGGIPDGLSRKEVQERFGSPGSVGTTSLGRQVEIHHLRQKFKSLTQRFGETLGGALLREGFPVGAIVGFVLVESVSFPMALAESGKNKLEVAFVYGPDDRVLYLYEPKAEPSWRYYQIPPYLAASPFQQN